MKLESKLLSDYLFDIGCCEICVLRFLRPNIDDFLDVPSTFQKKFQDCHVYSEPSAKKRKPNICIACFNLFDHVDEIVNQIKCDDALKTYEVDSFVTSYSLPVSLNLAQLQIWLSLVEKYPESFDGSDQTPDIDIKDVMKNIVNTKLCDELNKKFDPDGLMINIFFTMDDELSMMEKLESVAPELMVERNKQRKKFRTEVISRNYFDKFFIPKNINLKKFRELIHVPPKVPSLNPLKFDRVTFTGPTVFIAGRYNKYSRELSQSPWILDGKRMTEGSVQEIIVEVIAPHFMAKESETSTVTFMSSGREDVDVRCLGKGRPFAVEIMDARRCDLSHHEASEMEEKLKRSKLVSVRDIQMVRREDLHYIKSGEEDKRKFYRALCVVEGELDVDIMEKLQINDELEIQQWTPLRVLHRRTLMRRPRTIFSVKAHAVEGKPNLVVIDVVTQAGTYVKELVHGEFQRTSPSISSIIGKEIDIIALDVMNIDLNFPKEIIR